RSFRRGQAMDWRLVFFIYASLAAKAGCQSLSEATILTPPGQTVSNTVGSTVVLSCQVANVGSGKVNWVFVTHSLTIFHGDSLQVDDNRYSVKHPPHSNVYDLQIYPARESDQGSYKCEVDGTKKAVTIQLVLSGAPPLPEVDTTPLNRTECCIDQGVSANCQPVCHPSSVDDTFDVESACSTDDLLKLVHCGSDGRNHENCCANRNIPARCLAFCSNDEQKLSSLTDDELACLNYTDDIISCYEYGAVTLPGPPQEVSVLPGSSGSGQFGLLVSWKPPLLNPSAVTGYRISYKKIYEPKFRTTAPQSSTASQFTLNGLLVNTEYSVYVTALGLHGASQPSYRINTVLEDTCCVQRRVSPDCQTLLCHPQVWATFNTTNMLRCYHFLGDVFSCLAESQPMPPVQLTLSFVSAHEAHVSWTPSNHSGSSPIQKYYVQLRRGTNDGARWVTVDEVYGTQVQLTNLTETENYGVQVIAQNQNDSSLPSETLRFTTYPAELHYPVKPLCGQPVLLSTARKNSGLERRAVPQREEMEARFKQKTQAAGHQPSLSAPVLQEQEPCRRYDYKNKHAWMTKVLFLDRLDWVSKEMRAQNMKMLILTTARPIRMLNRALWNLCFPKSFTACLQPLNSRIFQAIKLLSSMVECCVDSGMPAVCAAGCTYQSNITDYYALHLDVCFSHIGQVLACGSDGRNHSACCEREGVSPNCLPLCAHTKTGELDTSFYACIGATSTAVLCFEEGLEDLVRMPDNLTVTNITTQHVQIEWLAPKTGPRPEKYIIFYKNVNSGASKMEETEDKLYILQNLSPMTMYEIKVASFLNSSRSPFTNTITAFTDLPDCCQSSGITEGCQKVCLNQPADSNVDCSSEAHKILVCSADGKDHTLCCQEGGLPAACLPLCSSNTTSHFNVQTAGCLADASLGIITSCFLSNANLVPSPPSGFFVDTTTVNPRLWWKNSLVNCDPPEVCSYDIHYWPADNRTNYRTIISATAPYIVHGLPLDSRFTFTVTARNSKGSSSAAPWQTVAIVDSDPDVSIAQVPNKDIHEVGSFVNLVCDAFGFSEEPTISWTHFGRVVGKSRRLNLGRITENSEGNYTCIAANRSSRITVNSYLNVRFKPQQTYIRTDTVSPNVGGEAILACWFRGHPFINSTRTSWTKDGSTVQVASSKYSSTAKTRLHTGITAFKLKIANVVPSDYGKYTCSVSNQYGTATGTTQLMDPDSMPPEATASPSQRQNITGCCSRYNVPEPCMRMCRFEVDTVEAVNNPDEYGVCLFYFNELVNCAADGADHTTCCKNSGVHPYCWPFCAGKIPPSENVFDDPELLQCVPQTPTMFKCLARGYDRIPTAPSQIRASLESDYIVLQWSLPTRNQHRVEFYEIFYNSTGNPVPQKHFVAPHVMNYTIENVLSNHIYNIWMIAGNDNGQSHRSRIVSVSVHGALPMPPSNVQAVLFEGTSVDVTWVPPPPQSSRVDGYAVFYKPANAVKFSDVRTRDNTVRIHNLDPETEYELYVKSVNVQGLGLIPTKTALQVYLGHRREHTEIGGLPGEAPYDNVMQPQNQPREDGTFGYARLNEDQAAATAAAASSKAVSEMEYPSDKYVYDTPAGVKPDTNGTSQDVATLPVSDITPHTNNESTT
ncbi:hypothetical protein BaRGS_00024964, partial [Batillaria attramentaria]